MMYVLYSDIGPYEDVQYKCKWFSPLDKLTVLEPDYNNDIWDDILREGTVYIAIQT